ncbi:MAG: hypothetical protein PUC73_08050 [Lachnospiraceae bacterium]|nr:hypothetical protein [Lachnospiraceae bacterium]
MKKKSVAIIITLSMMLSAVGCGSKTEDTLKESKKESQVVAESNVAERTETSEPVVETTKTAEVVESSQEETTEAVKSVEPSQNEAETTESEKAVVTDSRFDVEIIGTCAHWDGMNVTVYSITNVSDASYSMWGSSQIVYEDENKYGNIVYEPDAWFTAGETVYGYAFMENDSDKIDETMILEAFVKSVSESSENTWTDTELHKETYTSDGFNDAVNFVYDNVYQLYNAFDYLILYYQNDELIGITKQIQIEGNNRENGMSNPLGADKIDICWLQGVDSHKPSN